MRSFWSLVLSTVTKYDSSSGSCAFLPVQKHPTQPVLLAAQTRRKKGRVGPPLSAQEAPRLWHKHEIFPCHVRLIRLSRPIQQQDKTRYMIHREEPVVFQKSFPVWGLQLKHGVLETQCCWVYHRFTSGIPDSSMAGQLLYQRTFIDCSPIEECNKKIKS